MKRKPSAVVRLVASVVATGALLIGYGPVAAPQAAMAPAGESHTAITPGPGSIVPEPVLGDTALLIGDSQSAPAGSWPRNGLAAVGYDVHFSGLGGTGFVASNGETGNYLEALREGDWELPGEVPSLIVVQGGGNDATQGATDDQIEAGARALIAELKNRYPHSTIAMIGTLARGVHDGGGRRSEVDALLGRVAKEQGLPFVAVGDWLTRYGLAKDLADTVHMTPAGHQALGALLENRFRELHLERASLL